MENRVQCQAIERETLTVHCNTVNGFPGPANVITAICTGRREIPCESEVCTLRVLVQSMSHDDWQGRSHTSHGVRPVNHQIGADAAMDLQKERERLLIFSKLDDPSYPCTTAGYFILNQAASIPASNV